MGGKRIRPRKYFHLCIAGLIFLSASSCAIFEKATTPGEKAGIPLQKTEGSAEAASAPPKGAKEQKARAFLLYGRKLFARGDYEGSLRANQQVVSLSPHNPPADEALFNLGLIHAHPANPKKNLRKSSEYLKNLIKDFPQSLWVEQAKMWMAVFQEIEILNQDIERLKQEVGRSNQALEKSNQNLQRQNEMIRQLNEVIERSRQVDLEIEERKREKGR